MSATAILLLSGCDNTSTPDSTTASIVQTDTEVNATESETTSADKENETTAALPDDMAYQLEDESFISIDELLAPMNKLNSICQGVSSTLGFTDIYPKEVLDKLIEYNHFTSMTEYADFLYTTYVQMYGDIYSLSNEYISCTPLDDNQLKDMIDFYKEFFFTDIKPEFAFIVESEFCVTYNDEEGNEQRDCSSDYYIAYRIHDVIYLDYFYVDSLDL